MTKMRCSVSTAECICGQTKSRFLTAHSSQLLSSAESTGLRRPTPAHLANNTRQSVETNHPLAALGYVSSASDRCPPRKARWYPLQFDSSSESNTLNLLIKLLHHSHKHRILWADPLIDILADIPAGITGRAVAHKPDTKERRPCSIVNQSPYP